MSKKILRTVGKIAGVVAAVAMIGTGIGAALGGTMLLSIGGVSVAASAIAGAASLVSLGASLLTKPKSPKIGAANEERLQLSLDVRTPRKMAFGTTALGTDLRDQEFTGTDKEYLHRFVVVAAHKVQAIKQIWFDDQLAWTVAGGVQAPFSGYLTVTPVLEGGPGNAINISARLGSSRRFTGCAYVYFRFKLTGNSKKTESPFAQQVPTRITIIGDGIRCYDPRQDSTVPGGEGNHRADDQSTWTWGDHCHNTACQLATWLLGWRIQNPQSETWKLSVGAGIPPERIDWPSFVEGANLCDEDVALSAGGTEPRYRSGGLVDEDDGPLAILEAFKAAMNADLDDQDGLIRLTVFHNDLATPDADFTEADVQGEYLWHQTQPLNESFNVVRGNYVEPDTLYQPAPYLEAAVPSPDGIERVHPADFGLVQSRGQAERLAKQRLQRQLYGGEFRATFLASAWKVHKNSVVRLTFAPEGWVNKLFRVAEYEVRQDGLVPMVLREEHEDIYAWDAEESPAVQLAEPTYYAPGDAPIPQFLGTIEEGATKGAPEGTEVAGRPAEDLVGQVDEHEDAIGVLDAALGPLEDAANDLYGEVERLDGRVDEADGAISAVASDLETEAERLDGRIDDADAAIAAARARLQTEAERLKAMIALAGVGVLAEVQTRADAVAAEVTRIDGILASLDDPDGGLDAAHALIATLETATVDLENPASLASQIEVLEAAIDTAEGSLSARVTTLETATASMAGDIADNAGAIADNAGDIVALAGRTDTIEAELDAQGEDIGEIQAAVTAVEQAAVTSRAAAAYAAERMAAQVGLSRVSVLAERRAAASETQAEASRIDAIEAEIDDPDDGLPAAHAAIASLETAVVDLETVKAEASDVEALEVALTDVAEDIGDLDGRLTSAEGSIITHTSAIAGLVSDVSTLDGGLALLADEVSGIDGRLTTAEGTVTTLVSTATSLSARMTDAEADIASIAGAAVTSRAAAAYAAQRMAAQVGLSRVSVLAERRAAASETQAEASRIDAIEAEIDDPDDGLPAAHAAIASLETAVVDLETVKAEASDLAALVAEIEDEETGLASKASVTALNSAVADLEGDISAVASSVSTVSAEVGDLSSAVTEVEEAAAGIGARWGVVIDVNGRVAGVVRLDGTDSESVFEVVADKFKVTAPGGGPGLTWEDGLLWNKGETASVILGQAFGVNGDLQLWIGPNPASPSAASKSNAKFWVDTDGVVFFGGISGAVDVTTRQVSSGLANATSFTPMSDILTLIPSASTVSLIFAPTATISFYSTGLTFTYEVKWQFSADESSWSDISGQTVGGGSVPGDSGSFFTTATGNPSTGTKTGLTPGVPVYFRVVYRVTAGAPTGGQHALIAGPATADGSS